MKKNWIALMVVCAILVQGITLTHGHAQGNAEKHLQPEEWRINFHDPDLGQQKQILGYAPFDWREARAEVISDSHTGNNGIRVKFPGNRVNWTYIDLSRRFDENLRPSGTDEQYDISFWMKSGWKLDLSEVQIGITGNEFWESITDENYMRYNTKSVWRMNERKKGLNETGSIVDGDLAVKQTAVEGDWVQYTISDITVKADNPDFFIVVDCNCDIVIDDIVVKRSGETGGKNYLVNGGFEITKSTIQELGNPVLNLLGANGVTITWKNSDGSPWGGYMVLDKKTNRLLANTTAYEIASNAVNSFTLPEALTEGQEYVYEIIKPVGYGLITKIVRGVAGKRDNRCDFENYTSAAWNYSHWEDVTAGKISDVGFAVDFDEKMQGKSSLRITSNMKNVQGGVACPFGQWVTLKENTDYILRYYAKTDNLRDVQFITQRDGGSWIYAPVAPKDTTQWQEYTYKFNSTTIDGRQNEPTSSTEYRRWFAFMLNNGGSLWLDGISLREVNADGIEIGENIICEGGFEYEIANPKRMGNRLTWDIPEGADWNGVRIYQKFVSDANKGDVLAGQNAFTLNEAVDKNAVFELKVLLPGIEEPGVEVFDFNVENVMAKGTELTWTMPNVPHSEEYIMYTNIYQKNGENLTKLNEFPLDICNFALPAPVSGENSYVLKIETLYKNGHCRLESSGIAVQKAIFYQPVLNITPDGAVTAEMTVWNNAEGGRKVNFYLCRYSGERLVDVTAQTNLEIPVQQSAFTASLTLGEKTAHPGQPYTYRAYVWDGEQKPLTEVGGR